MKHTKMVRNRIFPEETVHVEKVAKKSFLRGEPLHFLSLRPSTKQGLEFFVRHCGVEKLWDHPPVLLVGDAVLSRPEAVFVTGVVRPERKIESRVE